MIAPMPEFHTQFDRAEDSPGFMLWRVSNLWQRHIKAALEPLEITHVQFVLLASLAWLSRGNQPLNQAQLAAHVGIDVMMTSQVLRALEAKGLVQRIPDPADARAFHLSLSKQGLKVANQAVLLVEEADRAFFARADSPETLLKSLKQLSGL